MQARRPPLRSGNGGPDGEGGGHRDDPSHLGGRVRTLIGAAIEAHTEADLAQLRGFYEVEERSGRAQLDERFLHDHTGMQLLTVAQIISEVVDELKGRRDVGASTKWSAGTGWMGRSMTVEGWHLYLYISFNRWGRLRDTPLWLRIRPGGEAARVLQPLFDRDPPAAIDEHGVVTRPIELQPGVDRSLLRSAVEEQVLEVCHLLRDSPRGSVDDPGDVGDSDDPDEP